MDKFIKDFSSKFNPPENMTSFLIAIILKHLSSSKLFVRSLRLPRSNLQCLNEIKDDVGQTLNYNILN